MSAGLITIDTGRPVPSTATCNSVPVTLEPDKSDHIAPLLEGTGDESTDVFCRSILPDLCADLIARPKVFFHMPNSCHPLGLGLAAEPSPHVFGISLHLHPETGTQMIPFKTVRSLPLGRPVAAAFGSNGSITSHCLSSR